MIVDDQSYNIDAMMIILSTAFNIDTSQACSTAFNGNQALKKVQESVEFFQGKQCGYEVILMDCNMPFMDGYEATVCIREYLLNLGLDQPIIAAVTGHTEQQYVQRCFDCGMNQVFSKPIDIKSLRQMFLNIGILDE